MLGTKAAFVAQGGTFMAGDSEADQSIVSFTQACAQKHLSVTNETIPVQDNTPPEPPQENFWQSQGKRMVVMLSYMAAAVLCVVLLGKYSKKKAD